MSADGPIVWMLLLGGTIAMVDEGDGLKPGLSADGLVAGLGLSAGIVVESREIRHVPSAHLTMHDVLTVARTVQAAEASGVWGVVVVQGTDTLEETAFALDLLVGGSVPVVVTGAMRGPQALGADGPANLSAALAVAADPAAAGRGVLVVMGDQIHAARWVRKEHTSLPEAFGSPAAGPVGRMSEGVAHWLWPRGELREPLKLDREPGRVLIVPTWLGDDGALLRAAIEASPDGVVIEGLGAGHVPPALVPLVSELAQRVPVVLTSSAGSGDVHHQTYDYAGSEIDLLRRQVIHGGDLTARQARIKLSLELGRSGAHG